MIFFSLRAHAYLRTYGRTLATLTPTPSLTPALGRVARTDGQNPRARVTYIVVTYAPAHAHTHAPHAYMHPHTTPTHARYIHSRHLHVPVIRKKYKSAGQRYDIVISEAKAVSQKIPTRSRTW
jgi:hypothetical protein